MKKKQKYTSANTSINSKKKPRIYKLISNVIGSGDKVIDYGCGKYFDNYNLGKNFFGYDPFNRNIEELLNDEYDVALCSNVLNVIMEKEVRLDILETLKQLAPKVFITVYEGDKSRCGKVSKEDCFQLNWQRGDYIPELVEAFGASNVHWNKRGYFVCERAVV